MRKTFAEIDLGRLKENFLNIRNKTNTRVMAVVKADAYGHGMLRCVEALESLGSSRPEYYAVALLEEAIELRKSFPSVRILVFAPAESDELVFFDEYDLIATVGEPWQLEMLEEAFTYRSEKPLKVHLKTDTGMGRIGVRFNDAAAYMRRLIAIPGISVDGIYTHFATSDEYDKSFAGLQLERFCGIVDELKASGVDYGLAHCSNSGAILDMPDAYFDMVRPGIILYGYYPSLDTSASVEVSPVMSLISTVSTVKRLKKGETVSYGRRYTASEDTTIVTVPIGYADGFVRGLTNRCQAIINGNIIRQAGQVCMDRIMFEAGDAEVSAGDRVVLLGRDGEMEITAWDWSKVLGTIPYEITCNISKRVPRLYIE